jgi:hypothetical protein
MNKNVDLQLQFNRKLPNEIKTVTHTISAVYKTYAVRRNIIWSQKANHPSRAGS